ncbi:YesL family protein [Alkalicoccus urumqiensis]|uniref:DUF624 domain-containing protein n=1 Tax=Alkalicoccus urumqiensis TaxID=1548213 RepID=A0A2P6MIE2_ALKUR|nr:DUF624 domain-containing protein [Alkalicoccus urumqiensis]PRO66041.1 hypothetical protein C6I21_06990 [Alkalicoccus urumqiensis]
MQVRWMNNHIYTVCDWLVKLAYLQFLWVLFTLAGGIVFGLFPSTAAVFHQLGRMIAGGTGRGMLPQFAGVWKTSFKRMIPFALLFWSALGVFSFNLLLLTQMQGMVLVFMMSGMALTFLIGAQVFLFFFPVFARYPDALWQDLLRLALFLPFTRIRIIAAVFFGSALLAGMFYMAPVLITFWGVTAFFALTAWAASWKLPRFHADYEEADTAAPLPHALNAQ